jgi:DNA-binding transcriptional ArsR family regulator
LVFPLVLCTSGFRALSFDFVPCVLPFVGGGITCICEQWVARRIREYFTMGTEGEHHRLCRDLAGTDWRVDQPKRLSILVALDNHGQLTFSGLGRVTDRSPRNLAAHLGRLEGFGYVTIARDELVVGQAMRTTATLTQIGSARRSRRPWLSSGPRSAPPSSAATASTTLNPASSTRLATELDLSRERVRRLQRNAEDALRHTFVPEGSCAARRFQLCRRVDG